MKQQIEIQNCTLSNPKHEKFAQSIARGLSQEKAYIEAGFCKNGARQNASRLITNDNILRRVKEIQNDTQLRNNIEIDDIIDELEKTRKLAMALGNAIQHF